jgi:MoaA/NifB/PqqE/SkfB family radical SAM enzyme
MQSTKPKRKSGARPAIDDAGRIAVPSPLAARFAGADADELVWEAIPNGVRLTVDRLRKVYVEASGRCNLQCAMCPRGAWADDSGDMSAGCFDKLLTGLPPTEPDEVTLAFGGFGEPTLHPRFLDMVEDARRAHCRVEIITNGTTITDAIAGELALLGVAQVTVSIDGGDERAFAVMRGTDLAPAVEALATLRVQARRGVGHMSVGVASVATRQSVESLPAVITMAQRLKLDFVSISNVVPHTRQLADQAVFEYAAQVSSASPENWRPHVSLGRFDVSAETRPLLDALFRQSPVVPPPALDAGGWRNRCRFAREGMVAVSWDGRVAPCLSLLYTHNEHLGGRDKTVRAFEVGDVERAPLREIWREPAFRALRARLREFDQAPCLECGGCDISETNEGDCFGTPFPACSECLWAQGIVLCP